jgi:hypothetical protein
MHVDFVDYFYKSVLHFGSSFVRKGNRENIVCIDVFTKNEIRDLVGQYSCLPRSRSRQNERMIISKRRSSILFIVEF